MKHRALLITLALMSVVRASTFIGGTVALVDQTCITHHDVLSAMEKIKAHANQTLPDNESLYTETLSYLIEQEALMNEAKDRNIDISDADIRHATHQTDQIKKEEKESIRKELTIMTLQDAALYEKHAFPSKADVEKLIEEEGEEHITVSLNDWLAPDENTAKEIQRALLKGQEPIAGAQHHYQDEPMTNLPDLFQKALKKRAKQDKVLDPIKTGNGYHVLAIEHIRGTLSKQQAYAYLRQKALQKIWPEWTASVLKHHYIMTYPTSYATSSS
jgi:hypothetical protein